MPEIVLYNLLKRLPDATNGEVERAIGDITGTKEIVTKSDIVRQGGFAND